MTLQIFVMAVLNILFQKVFCFAILTDFTLAHFVPAPGNRYGTCWIDDIQLG